MNQNTIRLCFVISVAAVFAGSYGAVGDTALPKGGLGTPAAVEDKTALLEKKYRKNPSSTAAAFAYAKVATCSLSVALFTKVAQDTNASDSLRAAAYEELGDYSFVQNAFKTAAEKYRKAFELHAEDTYALKRAQSAAAMNDTATALPVYEKLCASDDKDIVGMARYGCALMQMKVGRFDSALVMLSQTTVVDTMRSWTIATAAARMECALRTGKKEVAAEVDKQLQPFGADFLERHQLDVAKVLKQGPPTGKAVIVTPAGIQSEGGEYTLQVGAFGTLDNATALQKKLLAAFSDVSILPVTLAENVFYRVRVGTFKNRNAADAFAEDSLLPKKISYKVVEK